MNETQNEGRRRFLGLVGAAAGGAAAGPAEAFRADGMRGDLPPRPEDAAERRKPRYRETEHVLAFYRTNRS